MEIDLAPALGVAAALLGLALLGGGAGAPAIGLLAVVAWLALGALALVGRLPLPTGGRELGIAVVGFATLAAWSLLSVRWGAESGAAFFDFVQLVAYAGTFLVAALLARPGSAPSWLAGVALGGVLIAAVALVARLGGFGDDAELARSLPVAAHRISFPIGYWNGLGYLLAMSLPALAMLVAAARRHLARLAVEASVPVVLALYLTFSRGALASAVLAVVVVAALGAGDRSRLRSAVITAGPAWVVTILVAAAGVEELPPHGAPLGFALLLGIVTLAAALLAGRAFDRRITPGHRISRRSRSRRSRRRAARLAAALGSPRRRALAAIAALLAAVAVIGPDSLTGEFRIGAGGGQRAADQAITSDSGRGAFWGAALDAFAEDPLRGVGAGGYASWWAANGELRVAVASAHSTPLQALAELGIPGGAALLAVLLAPLLAARRLLRGGDRGARLVPVTALAVFAIGLVAIGVDWSWELGASALPLLIAAGLLCGPGVEPVRAATPARAPAGAPPAASASSRPRLVLAQGAVLAAAAVSIWAGTVLGAAGYQLERSSERLAVADVADAARAARSAIAIEPWAMEPYLRLAEVEQLAGNLDAARRRAEQAAQRGPDDFRPWALLATIHAELGNDATGGVYLSRALGLGLGRVEQSPIRQ